MASDLGGQSFDICSQSISSAIESFSDQLHNIRLEYRTRILFLASEPSTTDPITVVKTLVDGSEVQIPQSATNGWTYVGYAQNVATIDQPILMSYGSGYAIQLNGTAALIGDERASVRYTVKGTQNVVEN
jgi:hypothetical protein